MCVLMIRFALFMLFCPLLSKAATFTPVDGGAWRFQFYKSVNYMIFKANPENTILLWQNDQQKNYAEMRKAKEALKKQGKQVSMMMNAGIFDPEYRPAGLWIENGKTLRPLNTRKGKGNFHIQPNGVFYLKGKQAGIMTTQAWQKANIKPDFALQSGPMLLIDGQINSRFYKEQHSPYKRNAVCITKNKELYFIITTAYQEEWPHFYRFAEALRSFGCYQALYLDGTLSNYYLTGVSNTFHWKEFAGMIAVLSEPVR